jgi:hypothetical protein
MTTADALRRLAPLALIVLVAPSCSDNDKSGSTKPTPPPAAVTTGVTGPSATSGRSGGNKLLIGKRDLYPLLGQNLQRFAPTQVTGKSVKVVALAGPESFWAGRGPGKRILVTLRLKGANGPKLRAGRKVDFVGLLTATSSKKAELLGVNDKAGQKVLRTEGVYVDVSVFDLKLH